MVIQYINAVFTAFQTVILQEILHFITITALMHKTLVELQIELTAKNEGGGTALWIQFSIRYLTVSGVSATVNLSPTFSGSTHS